MTVRPVPGVRTAPVAGGDLVLLFAGALYGLNATGAQIWAAVAEHGSFDRACELVAVRSGTPEARVRTEASGFIAALSAQGLVEVCR